MITNSDQIGTTIHINNTYYQLSRTVPSNMVEAINAKTMVLIYTDDSLNEVHVRVNFPDVQINEEQQPEKNIDSKPGLHDKDSTIKKINVDDILHDVVPISFPTLGGHTLSGKVDTGADLCSLHVDMWKANEPAKTVTFRIDSISAHNFTTKLERFQAIKTVTQEVTYRPVIKLNIIVNDKIINEIEFNLNDRSNMDNQVLIGNNLLVAGKFMIEPTKQ